MKFFTCFLVCLNLSLFAVSADKPNVIFILADDFGWGEPGFHGSSAVRTPNIDVLATNGIILDNYYVSPICSPSRSALLSGRHPIHTGLQHDVLKNAKPEGLPLQYKLLPQYMKDLGYETHLVGKWHQGFYKRQYLPTQRGFDSHFGYWGPGEDYYDRTAYDLGTGIDFRDNEDKPDLKQYEGLYSTHIYTNKSIDIIKNRTKPLFLYLAHQSVHAGMGPKHEYLQVPPEYLERFPHVKNEKRKKFLAMAAVLDDSVGEVVSALHSEGILNNTIIVFSTDNGGAVGKGEGGGIDGSVGSNYPLRGAKYTLFEGGVRGNSFIWSPLLKKQYVSRHLMHMTDWLPTLYTAVGGDYKTLAKTGIDGIDMWQTLNTNGTSGRKHLLHNIDDIWKVWGLRDGDYKLVSGSAAGYAQYNGWYVPPGETIHNSEDNFEQKYHKESKAYKVLNQMGLFYRNVEPIVTKCNASLKNECNPSVKPCLFDVASDPCEYHNLFDQKPQIVESMLKLLSQYNSTAVKALDPPIDPKGSPKLHDGWWCVWQ